MRTVQTTNHTTNDHFGIRSKLLCSNTQIEQLETWKIWGKASSKTSCKNGTGSPITQNFCGLPRSAVGLDPYWPIHPPKNQRDTVEFLRPAGQMGATMADLVHPAGITCHCDHGRAEADMCCSKNTRLKRASVASDCDSLASLSNSESLKLSPSSKYHLQKCSDVHQDWRK